MKQWVVVIKDPSPNSVYGPFLDEGLAHKFADFLSAEVDPAWVSPLNSPTAELLGWYSAEMDK